MFKFSLNMMISFFKIMGFVFLMFKFFMAVFMRLHNNIILFFDFMKLSFKMMMLILPVSSLIRSFVAA